MGTCSLQMFKLFVCTSKDHHVVELLLFRLFWMNAVTLTVKEK